MWYLDNVLPGEHGSPRKLYFPFQASYWGCCVRRNRKVVVDNAVRLISIYYTRITFSDY